MQAVAEALTADFANPSSVHQLGQRARHRLETARQEVAALVGAEPSEVVFTSGGTESINLAVQSLAGGAGERNAIVAARVEHAAVRQTLEQLERQGRPVRWTPVDGQGRIDIDAYRDRLGDDVALVCLQHANHETGVVQDVASLAELAAAHGCAVHVDAVQTAGKLPIDVGCWPVHAVSISAHKFHGPKGAGALIARRRTRLRPLLHGGPQERRRRAGTEAVPALIGMGVAARAAREALATAPAEMAALRDRLEAGVRGLAPSPVVIGAASDRLPNTACVSFPGLSAEALVMLLSEAGFCVSAGSACSSGATTPSPALPALGLDDRVVRGAVRFSLSRLNTAAEVDALLAPLPRLLERLNGLNMA